MGGREHGKGWRIRFRAVTLTSSPHNSNRTPTGSDVGDGLPMNGGEDSTKPTDHFFPQIQGGPQMMKKGNLLAFLNLLEKRTQP